MNRKVDGSRPALSSSSSTHPTCSRELLRRRVREDAVCEAGGAADRRLGATADEDRDPGRWRRTHPEGRELVDRALMGERLAAPRLRQDPEGLLHRRAATAHVGAQPGVLDLRPPSPSPSASRPWLSSWTVAASSARRSG